jgi:hypothetical protein
MLLFYIKKKNSILSLRPIYVKSLQNPEGAPNLQLTLLPCCYYRRQEMKNYNVVVATTGIMLYEVS